MKILFCECTKALVVIVGVVMKGCGLYSHRSPLPVVVSELTRENEEGLPDKLLQKNHNYSM